MSVKNTVSELRPVIIVFIVINAAAVALRSETRTWGIDKNVLVGGNLFLFAITLLSFLIAQKGLRHKNTNVFMRSVVGSITLKMFLAAIAAAVYILINKKGLNKPALFICMGLYLVYTFMEVAILNRMLRKPNE